MKILKASAGSGKTYNLAKEYISLLLKSDSPDSYRHVLAVTFTNKATDEMKRRILKELHILATAPDRSPYIDALVPSVMSTRAELKRKAEALMTSILHDYSSFAVSTIDKFFQQTLRAFSREIGQFTAYAVELDKDALVDEAVDKVLDGLSVRNRPLLDWIISGVRSDLERTGRFTLDRRMKDLAMSIVGETPDEATYGREKMQQLKDTCDAIISSYTGRLEQGARAVLGALEQCGVDPSDTNRGFLKAVATYLDNDGRELITPPTTSFIDKASEPDKWFAKTKAHLRAQAEPFLQGPLEEFVSLFGAPYREYATAMTLSGQIYGLGVASELREAFTEVQKERGVISIEDTNTILHDIIDGTDTPFVYEKLGVRFDDFLLDEFQDTSGIQWDNFLPLLQNSDVAGKDNLVVGDVKQSIYRWRGSQWDLLDSRLQQQFHVPVGQVTVLDGNYRTCKAIVDFNNRFFPYAASEIDRLVGINPASPESLHAIYGDVIQEVRTKDPAAGMVDVKFCDNADKEMEEIENGINRVLALGARYDDIAILVRGNAEGSAIAEQLTEKGIPVISDDSLYVKSSVTVRRLVSQLAIVDNPSLLESNSVAGFLAREMAIDLPRQFHGLTDLAETVLAELRKADETRFDAETPFIQAYMDWLEEWTGKNGNNLGAMLADWNEAKPKIASPEGSVAVRIMTVHKAKGLEFPYVIFPFAEKVALYKPTSYWCRPAVQGTALEAVANGRYRASLSDASANTLFREDYVRERVQQAVDNINVFYVALTRAKNGLLVISVMPPKAVVDAVENGSESVPSKSLSHILYSFVKATEYSDGQPYDFSCRDAADGTARPIKVRYVCTTEAASKRLCFRTSQTDDDEEPAAADIAGTSPNPQSVETNVETQEPTLF